MRKQLAIVLAPLFLILFLVAVTLNQVVDTVTDPDVVIGMMNDAEAYDYVYDNIIANLVHDTVEKGIEVNSGLGESAAPNTLRFDDPDAAADTITGLIEALVPREFVQEKFEQGLSSVVPYLRGDADEFTIDLEVQQRVLAVPAIARDAVRDLSLTERVIDDLLIPQVAEFSTDVFDGALGISFTRQENEDNARLIFAPEWLERQLFGAIDEITPYFAGEADSFKVVLRFDDRLVIIGQILKDKLGSQNTLYNLVFAQVIDPLIQQTVAQSTSVGFGISLTEQEVTDAFEVIAPRNWVREQGDGVIDALIDYLVGTTNDLNYAVDLEDRKTAATFELQALARRKLETALSAIPACVSPADAVGATRDLAARQLPRCLAGGQVTVNLALSTFGPIMDAQVGSFVGSQVPSLVSYSLSDFESQVGGEFDIVTDLRERVMEGVSFTEQDLIDALADENSPESRADAEEMLQILADGVRITEKNIEDNLAPAALKQFNQIRDYLNLGLKLRWLVWILVLLPLIGIAFLGGRDWAGRLKWAGGVAAVCALIVYAGIVISWSFTLSDLANEQLPVFDSISADARANYPRLVAELESDELRNRLGNALDSWQRSWRNQTVPWFIAGILAFGVGFAWPRVQARRGGGGTTPTPPVSQSAPSTVGGSSAKSGDLAIPADRGEEEPIAEEDRPTAGAAEDDSGSESGPEPKSDPAT